MIGNSSTDPSFSAMFCVAPVLFDSNQFASAFGSARSTHLCAGRRLRSARSAKRCTWLAFESCRRALGSSSYHARLLADCVPTTPGPCLEGPGLR
jgi:hypothetical protein